LYRLIFTIPKKTPEDNPYVERLQIKENFILRIHIRIPFGHRALAHMHIKYGHELFVPQPTKVKRPGVPVELQRIEKLWIEGDNEVLEFPVHYDAPEVPFWVTLEGWNESLYYDHSFYVTIVAMPKYVAIPYLILKDFVNAFKRLIGI